jgi:hypothetical protein
MTRSAAGNLYERIDAEPIPARLYAIQVALPDGTRKRLISPVGALPHNITDEPEAVRAARQTYAAAKAEEAARIADGRPPQPLTPELEAAFKTMSEFRHDFTIRQKAEFEARNQAIKVTFPGPRGVQTMTYWVPRNLTAEAKANNLASLDKIIAKGVMPMQEALIKAREMVAELPVTN